MQSEIKQLLHQILPLKNPQERHEVFNQKLEDFDHLGPFSSEERYLLGALISLGQKKVLQPYIETREELLELLHELKFVDRFYADFGGIVGYQNQVLELLSSTPPTPNIEYHPPQAVDIGEENFETRSLIFYGIQQMGKMAEMYAIGGAADRLGLKDEKSGIALPAAKLVIANHTLLGHMIRDLFAREYIHYRLFGKQVKTPIAMMTSREKDNDTHVRRICEENEWFGRDKESFFFFCQPLVPTFAPTGHWAQKTNDKLLLKPGGHGVIWKLAHQEKVLDKLKKLGCSKALVRQINNPIAGVDSGLLAFTGVGLHKDQMFGFASCPRRKNAKEGVNVMKKHVKEGKAKWSLSNIEYCDLRSESIESSYPANTNILFVDLDGIAKAVKQHPYPGVVINFKEVEGGDRVARLELTMQNIADYFEDTSKEHTHSYLTVNRRQKTISAAKKAFLKGESLLETPEGCLLDMQRNAHELFTSCEMKLPSCENLEETYFKEPPFYITYHPALGPNYSLIRQKIRGGELEKGSELRLDIAEASINNLHLSGSLIVTADTPMGHKEEGLVVFSQRASRAILDNVKVVNKGVDKEKTTSWVCGNIVHQQQCLISLAENAEFIARDVTLQGDCIIRVPENKRCIAKMQEGKLQFEFEELSKEGEPLFKYSYSETFELIVQRVSQ